MVELQVTNSPFNQEQVELLNRLIPTLNDGQKTWLSGYLTAIQGFAAVAAPAGVEQQSAPSAGITPASTPAVSKGSYGTLWITNRELQWTIQETGEKAGRAGASGDPVVNGRFQTERTEKVENLLIIVSTHGEGEPPDNAIPLHEFLHSKRAPKLDGLRYSVLALGDTSYEFFVRQERILTFVCRSLAEQHLYHVWTVMLILMKRLQSG